MDISALCAETKEKLSQKPQMMRRLVLIHTAIMLAAELALTLLHFLLARLIGNTSGLSGVGTRSVLTTVQTVLQIASVVILPLWEVGIVRAAMVFMQRGDASENDLTMGFRRTGAVLRFKILEILLFGGMGLICIYVASIIFSLTPLSKPFQELLMPLLTTAGASPEELLAAISPEEIQNALLPMIPIAGILAAIVMIPFFYRLRMADHVLMDDTPVGALAAMRTSMRLMRGNCRALFRLDLRLWWFYLAQAACMLIGEADRLFPALGERFGENTAFFGAYIISIVLQLLLLWRCGDFVYGAYVVFHESLTEPDKIMLDNGASPC